MTEKRDNARPSKCILFYLQYMFYFFSVRGGIIRSQCFHLVVHFFDGCGVRDSQIQEFLKLLAWLDSLANITNQHHTYTDFSKVFYVFCLFFFSCINIFTVTAPQTKKKLPAMSNNCRQICLVGRTDHMRS